MKMKKKDWYPTKYEKHHGHWRGSRRSPIASRIVEDLQAGGYEAALLQFARGRLIDLGCGNAPLAGLYASQVNEFVWADWPVSSDRQIFELDYEVDLNGPLPFSTAEFDTVLLSDVLEHIAEPDFLMGELSRITRPDGHIIIGVPFMYGVHEKPHDYHRYTRFKLEHFAQKNSLEVVWVDEIGGALDVWSDLTSKLCYFMWPPLAVLPYSLWLGVKRMPFVRRLNRKTAWKYPLAYIAVFRQTKRN